MEVLGQPLEDGKVTISRAAGTLAFPSKVLLIGSLNPCPCGYFGDPSRSCSCSLRQVERYRSKISGPLLDRMDLHIEVPLVEFKDLSSRVPAELSSSVRQRVGECRERQRSRFGNASATRVNSEMTPEEVRLSCEMDSESSDLMEHAMSRLGLSARGYDRILKVARTVADLEGSQRVLPEHFLEAIQFRSMDRKLIG